MTLRRTLAAGRIAAISFACTAGYASAHNAESLSGGFQVGFLHPLSGVDHMLAMIVVGLWGAFLGRPLIFVLPIIFPTVMAFGGALGMIGVPMPPVEIGIAISLLVLGCAIAASWRAPVWLACLAVGVFALFHGYAHGAELPSMADPIAFSLGFVFATGSPHILGIAVGLIASNPTGKTVVRVVGAAIALAGIYYLLVAVSVLA